jgi:dUTP pyrophosphatase
METMPMIEILRLNETARLPRKAHDGDAAYDLFAAETAMLEYGVPQKVGTGIAIGLAQGLVGKVCPRSGLALKGVTVFNAPGIIDSGYRGEIGVILVSLNRTPYRVECGDRIAQLLIQPALSLLFREVDALDWTDRGLGGFGSSGR